MSESKIERLEREAKKRPQTRNLSDVLAEAERVWLELYLWAEDVPNSPKTPPKERQLPDCCRAELMRKFGSGPPPLSEPQETVQAARTWVDHTLDSHEDVHLAALNAWLDSSPHPKHTEDAPSPPRPAPSVAPEPPKSLIAETRKPPMLEPLNRSSPHQGGAIQEKSSPANFTEVANNNPDTSAVAKPSPPPIPASEPVSWPILHRDAHGHIICEEYEQSFRAGDGTLWGKEEWTRKTGGLPFPWEGDDVATAESPTWPLEESEAWVRAHTDSFGVFREPTRKRRR